MMLPSFRTERLWLRPRTMGDFAACLAMDRDPEVTRFVAGPWDDPVRHERFLRERIGASFGEGLGYWSVVPKDTDGHGPERFLGWVMLIPEDGVGPAIEIGWRFNRLAWGRGYATEAARPVLEHGLRTLGLSRIVAAIDPRNGASIRVAEKIGLRYRPDGRIHAVTADARAVPRRP